MWGGWLQPFLREGMHIPEGCSAGLYSSWLHPGDRIWSWGPEVADVLRVHRLHEHPLRKGSCCLPALAFRVPTRASEDCQMVTRQPILWIEIRTPACPLLRGERTVQTTKEWSSRVYDNFQTQHRKKEPCWGTTLHPGL